jgi:hypothetical protein
LQPSPVQRRVLLVLRERQAHLGQPGLRDPPVEQVARADRAADPVVAAAVDPVVVALPHEFRGTSRLAAMPIMAQVGSSPPDREVWMEEMDRRHRLKAIQRDTRALPDTDTQRKATPSTTANSEP